MAGPAFFSFWADRFIGATETWSEEEVGAYLRLLLYQFREGSIPSDPAKRARLVRMPRKRFESIWNELLADKFKPIDGGELANPKMVEERERAAAASKAQSLRAKRGWASRGDARADAGAEPEQSAGDGWAMQPPTSDLRPPTQTEESSPTPPRPAVPEDRSRASAPVGRARSPQARDAGTATPNGTAKPPGAWDGKGPPPWGNLQPDAWRDRAVDAYWDAVETGDEEKILHWASSVREREAKAGLPPANLDPAKRPPPPGQTRSAG